MWAPPPNWPHLEEPTHQTRSFLKLHKWSSVLGLLSELSRLQGHLPGSEEQLGTYGGGEGKEVWEVKGGGGGECKPPPSPAEMIFCKEVPLNPSSCWFLGSEDSTQNTAPNPLNAALSRFPPHVLRQDLSLEPRAWSQGSCHHVPSTGATTKHHYTWLFMWLLGLELKSSCNLPTEATPHPAPHTTPTALHSSLYRALWSWG